MSEIYKKTVKLVFEQKEIPEPSGVEGFPMREWSIEILVPDVNGQIIDAKNPDHVKGGNPFEKIVYRLHPTFPKPVQTLKKYPFKIKEKGWGEFDMQIELHTLHKGATHTLDHDLNFQQKKYVAEHVIEFSRPKPELVDILKYEIPPEPTKKKASKKDKMVDMEKLAEGLQKLGEDDLLQVVQMIHDNKTSETYTKNDIDNGEFHVDLYTLPDPLVKSLWDFTQSRTDL